MSKHIGDHRTISRGIGFRAVVGALSLGLVAGTLTVVAGPVAPASADTGRASDGIGWYRPSDSSWHLSFTTPPNGESDAKFVFGPGNSGGIVPVAGDWDGDGASSIAWYRHSDASWHFSSDLSGGPSDATFVYGPAGNSSVQPIAGDWDGDGKDTVGWYRPSDGSYHLASKNDPSATSSPFVYGPAGNASVQAIAGDWDGNGKDTVGWYRPSDGSYHLASKNDPSATSTPFVFGPAGNTAVTAVAGDWDGDGKSTVGWYRPSDGSWHLSSANTTGAGSTPFVFGTTGDPTIIPVAGDWDGKVSAPTSPTLPTNSTAEQTVQYARSYVGKTLPQIRPGTSAPWSSYGNYDWCAWFATWVLRDTTGGAYYTYVDDTRRLGTATITPRVGDLVLFGDYHVGIVSKYYNGRWYLIDGNGASSGNGPANTIVQERPIWDADHTFVRISY